MAEKEYIEREDLLDTFENAKEKLLNDISISSMLGVVVNDIYITIIKNYPTVKLAPVRHAKWELIDECVNEGVYCSNCHKKIYRAEYANQKVKSKYCPNCGSRMDGDTE